MVDKTGTFNCPHTGVALAVFLKLKEKKVIKPSDKIVIISTAHGLKFVEFKIGYHKDQFEGLNPHFSNRPIELPCDFDAVKDAVFSNIQAS